jgi:basic membrane lipoprotein Med (substrate-binding protein (PBP1-ABC) superfamily)
MVIKTSKFSLRLAGILSVLLLGSLLLAACGDATATPAPATTAAATTAAATTAASAGGAATTAAAVSNDAPASLKPGEKIKIGFLYVGPRDDYGYNYAADQGRQYLEKTLPWVETVYAENVPENAEAERVMEQMIKGGAKMIFPTSYGHLDPALKVADKYKNVTFFHMGGLKTAPNLGTFFGEIWQAVYAAGVAAGKSTKTNKLGYVVAFPIPQVLLNINAFELGARSVNPKATTTVVFSGDWCNPAKLSEAANSLADQGIDVISQHEDCPIPVIKTAEQRGIMSVGYHADASSFAPKGWITAATWNWGPLMVDLVKQAANGTYKPTLYRAGIKDGLTVLAPFGANVPDDVKKLSSSARDEIINGKLMPFKGPIKDQTGTVRIPDGKIPETSELESINWLVEGVTGTIPK